MISGRQSNRRIARDDGVHRWRWFAGTFFTVASVLTTSAAAIWLTDPAQMPIRSVRIDGEFRHLSAGRLSSVVAAEATDGFFSANVQGIRAAVMADPWVRDVSVRRIWPDALNVTVFEQRAIALWGENGLINDRGNVFRAPRETFPPGLIRLSGPRGSEGEVLLRCQQLQEWLRPLGLRVTGVELTSRRAWSFTVDGGIRVLVGRSDFETRVRRLIATLPRSPERLRRSDVIDLRYTNGFAVHPRAATTPDAG